MNCIDTHNLVDDYLLDDISDLKKSSIDSHVNSCDNCAQFLYERKRIVETLSDFHTVPAPAYLNEKIIKQRKNNVLQHFWKSTGISAIAASFIAFVLYSGLFLSGAPVDNRDDISAQLNSVKKVNFLVNSGRNLENVKFSVIVPPQLELSGFKGHSTLAWFGKLKQGNNLLSVPIIALDERPGMLIMRIEHKQDIKEYKINVKINRQNELSGFTVRTNA